MATMYSTTKPLMLLLRAADACLLAHACLEYPSLALLPPVSCPSMLQLRPPHLFLRAPASLLLLHAAPCILPVSGDLLSHVIMQEENQGILLVGRADGLLGYLSSSGLEPSSFSAGQSRF